MLDLLDRFSGLLLLLRSPLRLGVGGERTEGVDGDRRLGVPGDRRLGVPGDFIELVDGDLCDGVEGDSREADEWDLRFGVEGVSRALEGVWGLLRPFNIVAKMFKPVLYPICQTIFTSHLVTLGYTFSAV